jgi:hypothetical protein
MLDWRPFQPYHSTSYFKKPSKDRIDNIKEPTPDIRSKTLVMAIISLEPISMVLRELYAIIEIRPTYRPRMGLKYVKSLLMREYNDSTITNKLHPAKQRSTGLESLLISIKNIPNDIIPASNRYMLSLIALISDTHD